MGASRSARPVVFAWVKVKSHILTRMAKRISVSPILTNLVKANHMRGLSGGSFLLSVSTAYWTFIFLHNISRFGLNSFRSARVLDLVFLRNIS